jgi:hypothetical protein
MRSYRRDVDRLVKRYTKGGMSATEFGRRMDAIITMGHADAALYGRWRAGDLSPREHDDARFGVLMSRTEKPFLDEFVSDLQLGRYVKDGEIRDAAIRARAQMYVSKLGGTANETFVLASDPGMLLRWRLGAAEHCEDCLRLADKGGYHPWELPTYPKAGRTKCLTNCKCWLERSDGRHGFGSNQ